MDSNLLSRIARYFENLKYCNTCILTKKVTALFYPSTLQFVSKSLSLLTQLLCYVNALPITVETQHHLP